MRHKWVKSTLGHGETMCELCCMTNREAAALGLSESCSANAGEGHTHGPWVAEDDDGYSIWSIRGPSGLITRVIGDPAEAEANARLIASAPDLAAENERLRKTMSLCQDQWRDIEERNIEIDRLRALAAELAEALQAMEASADNAATVLTERVAKARAALAKARAGGLIHVAGIVSPKK